jgi:uncharacterized protein YqjF (DUF2071 family)
MAAPPRSDDCTSDHEPDGLALLRMAWSHMLFLHWPANPAVLKPLLPAGLDLDLYEGRAWITMMPLRMSGVRPALTPPIPGLSSSLEVNLRACVMHRGERGLFFFSLDDSNTLAVWLGRTFFHLPYFRARMHATRRSEAFRFTSSRTHQGASAAKFECVWTAHAPVPPARPGELTHFLTERRVLFHAHRDKIYRACVWHKPWQLREAKIRTLRSSIIEAAGLPTPEDPPLAHHCDQLAVSVSGAQEAAENPAEVGMLEPALVHPPPSFTFAR